MGWGGVGGYWAWGKMRGYGFKGERGRGKGVSLNLDQDKGGGEEKLGTTREERKKGKEEKRG